MCAISIWVLTSTGTLHCGASKRILLDAAPGSLGTLSKIWTTGSLHKAPEITEALLEQIQQTLPDDYQLRCKYFTAHGNKLRELVLNPLALNQRGNTPTCQRSASRMRISGSMQPIASSRL